MLKSKKKVLLIGGDSRLSKVFKKKYNKKYLISSTTRKNKKAKYFLDLNNVKKFKCTNKFDFVVFVGGAVSYDICENEYNYAKKINCINIPYLAKSFLEKKSHVIFISTNTVFKYKKKIPNERSITCPGFKYARLKNITEKKLLMLSNYRNKISIIRITKNLDKKTEPFHSWFKKLKIKKSIIAFKDLYFAPILYLDSAKIISKIIDKNVSGILHMSGKKDLNYCQFARLILKKLKLNKNYLTCTISKEIGLKLVYNHNITALNMKFTKEKLGIEPTHINRIINYLTK